MDKFGPQTAEIEAVLEKARNLTPEQAEKLNAANDTVPAASWDTALDTALDAVRDADRNVVRSVIWDAVWDAVWDSARNSNWNAVWKVVWDVILDVIWGAVLALLVKDEISEEHFNTLYGPWKSVMD